MPPTPPPMETLLLYIVYPVIVGSILAIFSAIYSAFRGIARRLEKHSAHLAVHASHLGLPFDD